MPKTAFSCPTQFSSGTHRCDGERRDELERPRQQRRNSVVGSVGLLSVTACLTFVATWLSDEEVWNIDVAAPGKTGYDKVLLLNLATHSLN